MDETVLTAGQLTQVGVANLTALGNVIQWQRLSYDFQFHTTEFDCDLVRQLCCNILSFSVYRLYQPVLVLSEGKSVLKVNSVALELGMLVRVPTLQVECHVPLVPVAADCPVPTPSLLLWAALRKYVTLCRGLDYSLTDEMKEVSKQACLPT